MMQIPMWNGALHIATPPDPPPLVMTQRGRLIEYVVPHPLFLSEGLGWQPLLLTLGTGEIRIEKPLTANVESKLAGTFGNQPADLYYSIWRVHTSLSAAVDQFAVFEFILKCAQWIRILGRQYWIFHSSTSLGALCRGSVFTLDQASNTQINFAGHGEVALLRPFDERSWKSIAIEVSSQRPIPVADSSFCDGLNSLIEGDRAKALVEFGTAAEVELTSLCDEASRLFTSSAASQKYEARKAEHSDHFGWKLDHAGELGLIQPAAFTPAGVPKTWVADLRTLYRFRNAAAHTGQCYFFDKSTNANRSLESGDLQRFTFAVEALFHWAQVERTRLGLPRNALQHASFTDRPIMAMVEFPGLFGITGVTSPSVGSMG